MQELLQVRCKEAQAKGCCGGVTAPIAACAESKTAVPQSKRGQHVEHCAHNDNDANQLHDRGVHRDHLDEVKQHAEQNQRDQDVNHGFVTV